MKTIIYPISNWSTSHAHASGSDYIVYNKNKYPICIGYDKDNDILKFTLIQPNIYTDQDYFYADVDNYWDICVGVAEFKPIDIYSDKYEEYRDFFTDDIKAIRDYYGNNFKRKFTNNFIYRLDHGPYVAMSEFGEDTDKILGIFIKKICKNFAYYLRLIKEIYPEIKAFNGSIYDNKSHKYLSDIFIALRHGYEINPYTMSDEEYKKAYTELENKFINMGFVSINDYCTFEESQGFIFVNPTTNKELIYFYKMLYNDIRNNNN